MPTNEEQEATRERADSRILTDRCSECGMGLYSATEYHPFAVCLMFKATRDSNVVRANVAAVLRDGATEDEWLLPRVRDFIERAGR